MTTRAREQSQLNVVYVVIKDGRPMAVYSKRMSAEAFVRNIGGGEIHYLPINIG